MQLVSRSYILRVHDLCGWYRGAGTMGRDKKPRSHVVVKKSSTLPVARAGGKDHTASADDGVVLALVLPISMVASGFCYGAGAMHALTR